MSSYVYQRTLIYSKHTYNPQQLVLYSEWKMYVKFLSDIKQATCFGANDLYCCIECFQYFFFRNETNQTLANHIIYFVLIGIFRKNGGVLKEQRIFWHSNAKLMK